MFLGRRDDAYRGVRAERYVLRELDSRQAELIQYLGFDVLRFQPPSTKDSSTVAVGSPALKPPATDTGTGRKNR